jgi:hypothetical protein
MSQQFSFAEHLSTVLWKETIWHNALRAAGAGVVWAFIAAFSSMEGNPLVMLFAMPVGYFLFLLPLGLVAYWLTSFIPLVGFFAGLIGLMVAIGDPLVYALNKFKPEWVPLNRPDFFSIRLITFVTSPFDE